MIDVLQVVLVGFTSDEVQKWIQPHLGAGLNVQARPGKTRPVLVAIGNQLHDPVREAAEWGFARPDAHVVLAVPAKDEPTLRGQLMTTPFLPQDLEVVSTDDPGWFRTAVQRVEAAIATERRLAQANAFLHRVVELV